MGATGAGVVTIAERSCCPISVAPEVHAAGFIEDLLTSAELVAVGQTYRFAELELYVWSESHPDPFSHRHPLQQECGRWYLHRTGTGFRNGSFKGLDLTLGSAAAYAAVLLRTLIMPDGHRIEGPSKIVDHLLRELDMNSPADLDRRLGDEPFWSKGSPLWIRGREREPLPIHRVPRVGLSLKRLSSHPEMPRFLPRPYRFLTDPKRTRKGRATLALGLHREGRTPGEIALLSGLPPRTIARYLAWYAEGVGLDVHSFGGRHLDVREHCRLLGGITE